VATETYGQGWSSQYHVVSTLAANGAVTTVTTASAGDGALGNQTYTQFWKDGRLLYPPT
jgi:hypothetical protein